MEATPRNLRIDAVEPIGLEPTSLQGRDGRAGDLGQRGETLVRMAFGFSIPITSSPCFGMSRRRSADCSAVPCRCPSGMCARWAEHVSFCHERAAVACAETSVELPAL
jgi:hypothetical protein